RRPGPWSALIATRCGLAVELRAARTRKLSEVDGSARLGAGAGTRMARLGVRTGGVPAARSADRREALGGSHSSAGSLAAGSARTHRAGSAVRGVSRAL